MTASDFHVLVLELLILRFLSLFFLLICRGRGSRALLKWFKSGVLVHDASYHVAVQLEGAEVITSSSLLQAF